MPLMRPVYYRERKGKLYTSSAYFLATMISSTLTLFFYPFVVGLLSYYFLSFDSHTAGDILSWIFIMALQAIAGCSFGFLVGSLIDDDANAIQILNLVALIFNMGAGSFTNLGNNPTGF